MSLDALQYLFNRRMPINYVSPPICEIEFSSSAFPTIVLTPRHRNRGPSGLEIVVEDGHIFLRWASYPGAICFSIYQAADPNNPFGDFVLVAECVQSNFDLTSLGAGVYRITAITLDGETPFSDPITVTGAPQSCTEDLGPACPSGTSAFDISSEVEWEELQVPNLLILPFFAPNPTKRTAKFPGDYPPGQYSLAYVSGMWNVPASGCGGGTSGYNVSCYNVADDQHYVPADNGLANGVNFPPVATGFSTCAGSPAAAQATYNSGPIFNNGAKRWITQSAHGNDGGDIRLLFDQAATGATSSPGGFETTFKLIQLSGLEQQPRKVCIIDWDTIKTVFSPTVQGWDGTFDTRDEYTSTTCVYKSSTFPGATAFYTQSHPTAANGCGWLVEISGPSGEFWQGTKRIGDTAEGQYLRGIASTIPLPNCLSLEDCST